MVTKVFQDTGTEGDVLIEDGDGRLKASSVVNVDELGGDLSVGGNIVLREDTGYTQTQLDTGVLDSRYYTEAEVNALTWDASDIVSGTFADGRISETSVTQHEGALAITSSQVSDFTAAAVNAVEGEGTLDLSGELTVAGSVSTGGADASDVVSGGIEIFTGTEDGYSVAFTNDDVAHPFTSNFPSANIFGLMGKLLPTTGGLYQLGISETGNVTAWRADGYSATPDTTDGIGSKGVADFNLYKSNGGTGTASLGTTDNALSIRNAGSTIALIKGSGDIHANGVSFDGGTNVLQDYEEGTWTPVVADAAVGGNTAVFTTVQADYTRKGREVTVKGLLSNIDTVTNSMTPGSGLYFRGLPFPVSGFSVGSCNLDNFTFSGFVTIRAINSTSYLFLAANVSGSADGQLTVAAINSGVSDISFEIQYTV